MAQLPSPRFIVPRPPVTKPLRFRSDMAALVRQGRKSQTLRLIKQKQHGEPPYSEGELVYAPEANRWLTVIGCVKTTGANLTQRDATREGVKTLHQLKNILCNIYALSEEKLQHSSFWKISFLLDFNKERIQ